MPIWKNASVVFLGGTEQVKQLYGRRVRARVPLQLSLYDPINNRQETTQIAAGTIGLVSRPHPTKFDFLIAFAKKPIAPVTTIEKLMQGGDFKVVMVNEPTFKQQFEIEA